MLIRKKEGKLSSDACKVQIDVSEISKERENV